MRTLNIRRWLFLFISTLLVGGITIIITNMIVGWGDLTGGLDDPDELVAAGIWIFIVGLMFSVISQMGFFAYLTIHRFGLGIFKTHKLWNGVQIMIIAFTFFDLVYLRYLAFAQAGQSWADFMLLPTVLLIVALIGGYLKAKFTNQHAFIPAVFFLYVVTTIEIVPAVTQNDVVWVTLMLSTILVCNLWQLLILQKLTAPASKKSA
ncbi:KinB-signaling pathway activation protein [Caldalkalibacillus salinus]|uniref:KinB-signaling pathway activation protein n=1 Tax=Caldalkalibacillus salinus TaxID=2803787 RepID=UPI003AFFADE0